MTKKHNSILSFIVIGFSFIVIAFVALFGSYILGNKNRVLIYADSVSDLAGTEWEIDSVTCSAGYGIFSVNYGVSSTVNTYSSLEIGYNRFGSPFADTVYCGNGDMPISVGDIIFITGGTDSTNSSLISWLLANATIQGGGVAPIPPEDAWVANNPVKATIELVSSFFSTEIFPGFKMYYIWLAGLGILFFGIIIKLWVH